MSPNSGCPYNTLYYDAVAAADDLGYSGDDYDHIGVFIPLDSSLGCTGKV